MKIRKVDMRRRILKQTRQDNAAAHACDKAVSHLREAHNFINSLMVPGAESVGKDIQSLIRKVEKLKASTHQSRSDNNHVHQSRPDNNPVNLTDFNRGVENLESLCRSSGYLNRAADALVGLRYYANEAMRNLSINSAPTTYLHNFDEKFDKRLYKAGSDAENLVSNFREKVKPAYEALIKLRGEGLKKLEQADKIRKKLERANKAKG